MRSHPTGASAYALKWRYCCRMYSVQFPVFLLHAEGHQFSATRVGIGNARKSPNGWLEKGSHLQMQRCGHHASFSAPKLARNTPKERGDRAWLGSAGAGGSLSPFRQANPMSPHNWVRRDLLAVALRIIDEAALYIVEAVEAHGAG